MAKAWADLILGLLRSPAYTSKLKQFFSTRYLVYDPGFLCRCYAGERPIAGLIPYREEVSWIDSVPESNAISIHKMRQFQLSSQPSALKLFQAQAYSRFQAQGKVSCDSAVVRLQSLSKSAGRTILGLQKARYSDQVQSNLVMDWSGTHALKDWGTATFRTFLATRHGNKLPPLTEKALANTIGVSVILFYRYHSGSYVPYLPERVRAQFRKQRKLAVFEGGYHCTASGAVEWSNGNTFEEIFESDMRRELEEEVGIASDDLQIMVPLVLCREFLRGGKPQIFFAGVTTLNEDDLVARRMNALEKQRALGGKIEVEHRHLRASSSTELREMLVKNPLTLEATANLYYATMFIEKYSTCGRGQMQMFFPSRSDHDAYVQIRNIVKSARQDLMIIDPYAGDLLWSLLRNVAHGVKLRILAMRAKGDFLVEAKKFAKQHGYDIEVRFTTDYHDRFIVTDGNACWHLGASVQHAGSKAFMISRMLEDVCRTVARIEHDWNKGVPRPI